MAKILLEGGVIKTRERKQNYFLFLSFFLSFFRLHNTRVYKTHNNNNNNNNLFVRSTLKRGREDYIEECTRTRRRRRRRRRRRLLLLLRSFPGRKRVTRYQQHRKGRRDAPFIHSSVQTTEDNLLLLLLCRRRRELAPRPPTRPARLVVVVVLLPDHHHPRRRGRRGKNAEERKDRLLVRTREERHCKHEHERRSKEGKIDDIFTRNRGDGEFKLGADSDIANGDLRFRFQEVRQFNNLVGDYFVPEQFIEKVALHVCKNFMRSTQPRSPNVPLILGVWGGKGCGKTFNLELACKKLGMMPIVTSAGELEDESAGEPGRLIRQRYR